MLLEAGWVGGWPWRGNKTLLSTLIIGKGVQILCVNLSIYVPLPHQYSFPRIPPVIKLHGALPDGIFSHFPGPPGTVGNTGQALLPQNYIKEFN